MKPKDFQEHINEEAKIQLGGDINEFLNKLRDHRFFYAIHTMKLKETDETLYTASSLDNGTLRKRIMEAFLPEYIEKKSKEMYKKLNNKL